MRAVAASTDQSQQVADSGLGPDPATVPYSGTGRPRQSPRACADWRLGGSSRTPSHRAAVRGERHRRVAAAPPGWSRWSVRKGPRLQRFTRVGAFGFPVLGPGGERKQVPQKVGAVGPTRKEVAPHQARRCGVEA